MNPIATELNQTIQAANPHVMELLSDVGKNLFFPKGILSQSAEAKEKAHKYNATIGIATEACKPMFLPSVLGVISGFAPEQSLTYAPSFGLPDLRKKWQTSLYDKNPGLAGKAVSLPVVTQAITHGLSVVGDMWLDPGDLLLTADKMWGNYNLIFGVRRKVNIEHFPLFSPEGGFDVAGFDKTVRDAAKTRDKITVLLNFPNNPTGYTPTADEAEKIAQTLTEVAEGGTNVLALCDDAYFGLFYGDCFTESVFTLLCDRHPRLVAVKLDAATKEDFVWGLRVGFVTYGTAVIGDTASDLYQALEKKTAGAVRGSISNASHLSQSIMLAAMESPNYHAEKADKRRLMRERAEEVHRVLSNPKFDPAWEVYPFNSGYFMCLKLKTVNAEALRVHLLDRYGVGLISIGKTDLRVAFSCLEKQDTGDLFDIVHQGIKDLEQGAGA